MTSFPLMRACNSGTSDTGKDNKLCNGDPFRLLTEERTLLPLGASVTRGVRGGSGVPARMALTGGTLLAFALLVLVVLPAHVVAEGVPPRPRLLERAEEEDLGVSDDEGYTCNGNPGVSS